MAQAGVAKPAETMAALAGTAAARVGPPSAVPPAPRAPRVVNLHAAFENAARHTTAGKIAGSVHPLNKRLKAAAASVANSCAEPNCAVSYQGGPVQHTPHVYLLLWGPNWQACSPTCGADYAYLYYLYDGLGVSPQDTWSTITSQYGDASGHPTFGNSVFMGAYQDISAPPATVTQDALAAEADSLTSVVGTDPTDAQVVVASQTGTCFSDGFAGNCGMPDAGGAYCAWHTYTNSGLPFTNLPYQPDAGSLCGENYVNAGASGTFDGFGLSGGHEYAESITDPFPDTGWTDPADTSEIGDKCTFGNDPAGDVALFTGTFAMQSLWSNAAGRCVMTSAPHLSVTKPGTQKNILGKAVSLQIHASSNTHTALSYTASGLPYGLSISKTSGRISGIPNTTAGTFMTTVTVSDYAGSAKVSFPWQVSSVAGPVKGYSVKCADDSGGRTSNGNKIDLWTCTGKSPQAITFAANGELQVAGKCITGGTAATLQTCTGTTAQTWTRLANGEYKAKSSGQCLTDPNNSTTNGMQLRISTCTNAANQHWTLP
jgi:hypothetical protein